MATGSKTFLWNGTDVRHDRQNWLAIGLHMLPNVSTSSGMLAFQSLACAQIFWQYITILWLQVCSKAGLYSYPKRPFKMSFPLTSNIAWNIPYFQPCGFV